MSDSKNRNTENTAGNLVKKRVLKVLSVLGLLMILPVIAMGVLMFMLSGDLPSIEKLENPELDLSTLVYTSDGELLTRYARSDRTPVPIDSVSTHVINALVSTEDYRFYKHWGVDIFRTTVSAVKTILGDQQGGSTLTQQLVRNLYREVGREVTVSRKIKEIMTGVRIERNYTKEEILEMYLNTIPFGYNTFGISTAAQTYFNKTPSQLNIQESATLVAILNGASFYNPRRYPERTRNRRNWVIHQMVKFGGLDENLASQARETDIELNFRQITHVENMAPYFAEQVRQFMQDWAKENDYNLYTDGLVVHTTLDSKMHAYAQEAVKRQSDGLQAVVDIDWSSSRKHIKNYQNIDEYLRVKNEHDVDKMNVFWAQNNALLQSMVKESGAYRNRVKAGESRGTVLGELLASESFLDSLKTSKGRLETGLIAIDPVTKHVKAWVGGRDYSIDKYDHVSIAKRQPGSTFKAFLYAAAIDNGYSPYHTFVDDSVKIELPGVQGFWEPKNSGKKFSGATMTLRRGIATSTNSIAAQLVGELGGQQVANYARLLGIESPLEPVHALALGVSDVSLIELANAYATMANEGIYGKPLIITRIEDKSGNVLEEFSTETKEVLSESTAYTMIDMLRGTVDWGTARRIRMIYDLKGDLAGKTGTTQNGADGWFMMMHPRLVMGSWVGFNDRRMTFRTSWWGQGGHNALFVVADFYKQAMADPDILLSGARFYPPGNYTVALPPLPDGENELIRTKQGGKEKGKIYW